MGFLTWAKMIFPQIIFVSEKKKVIALALYSDLDTLMET